MSKFTAFHYPYEKAFVSETPVVTKRYASSINRKC